MSAIDFDMASERQPDPRGDRIRVLVVIPGRGETANPEPMNTGSDRTRKNRCAQLFGPCSWVPGLMGWMAPSQHLCAKVGLSTTPTDGSHP